MSQKAKLDQLILRILKEEMSNLKELSPTTKFNAANAADNAARSSMASFSKDDIEYKKRTSQAKNMAKHVDPLLQNKADKIAKMIESDLGFPVEAILEKDNDNYTHDAKDLSMKLTFMIDKPDSEVIVPMYRWTITNNSAQMLMTKQQKDAPLSEPIMRQIAVLVKDIRAKELDVKSQDEDTVISRKDPQLMQKKKAALAKNQTVNVVDPNTTLEEESTDTPKDDKSLDLQEGPCGACIAGSLTELMDKLKALGEAAKDSKHQRLAEKTMKYLDAAKTALEGVVAHEAMLEEKEHAAASKGAENTVKLIKKYLNKLVKDPETLDKIMKKMPIEKALELKKKSKGDVDEEKVAHAMLKSVIKEGTFNIKTKLKEGQYGDAETSGKIEVEKNGQKIEGDAKLTYYTEDADGNHRIPTILITNNGKNVASIMFDKQRGKFIEGHTSGGATYEPVNDLAKKMFDELKNN